jgi:hypothetical protein
MKFLMHKSALAVCCAMCVLMGLQEFNRIDGTEFGGGMLFRWREAGLVCFLLALILAFPLRRLAATIALLGSLLSLPLYLYWIAPRAVCFLLGPCSGTFEANPFPLPPAIIKIVILGLTLYVSIRAFWILPKEGLSPASQPNL